MQLEYPSTHTGVPWKTIVFPVGAVAIVAIAVLSSFILALIIAGGLALYAVCASEQRYKYGLMALAAYTPFEEFLLTFWPDPYFHYVRMGPYAVLGAAFLTLWLVRFSNGRPIWNRTPADWAILLFMVLSGISMYLNAIPPFATAIAYQPFVRFLIIAFIALQFVQFTRRDLRVLVGLVWTALAIECGIAIIESVVGLPAKEFFATQGQSFSGYVAGEVNQPVYDSPWNVFGTMLRYNALGLYLGCFFAFTVPFAWRHGRPQWPIIALLCLVLPALIVATARAGWLAAIAGVIAVIAAQIRLRTALILAGVFAGLVFLIFLFFQDQVGFYGRDDATAFQRLLEPFSPKYFYISMGTYGRIYFLFMFPIELFLKEPFHFLFGYGPGALGIKAQEMFGMFRLDSLGIPRESQYYIVDVNWAYILGQAGIIATAAFVWLCTQVGTAAYRAWRREPDPFVKACLLGTGGYMTALMIGAFFGPAFEMRPTSLYFWLFGGIAVKLFQNSRQTQSN